MVIFFRGGTSRTGLRVGLAFSSIGRAAPLRLKELAAIPTIVIINPVGLLEINFSFFLVFCFVLFVCFWASKDESGSLTPTPTPDPASLLPGSGPLCGDSPQPPPRPDYPL